MSLVNVFGEVSSEATLAEIRDTIRDRSSSSGDAGLVSGTKLRYRKEFTDPELKAWNVVTGDGMTVAAGTGNLLVTTGTTANAVTTVTTKQTFSAPFKAAFGFKISQKIANQEFYCEVVAVNDDGTIDETVVGAWRIAYADSTSTTSGRVEVRNGGAARTQSAVLSGTPTQTADGIFEIVVESDEVAFHSRTADSTAQRGASTVRNSVAPDPNRKYALRYRIVNGAVAPATTTTLTASYVTAIDYTEIQTELTGGPGNALGSSALPVTITGGNVGLSNGTIGASTSVTGTSIVKINSAATTNATLVKNAASRLYGYHLTNNSAATKYLKIYNLTTTPVAGTSAVALVIPIHAGSSVLVDHTIPVSFATGFGYTITGGFADNDATAVAAGDVVGHLLYI